MLTTVMQRYVDLLFSPGTRKVLFAAGVVSVVVPVFYYRVHIKKRIRQIEDRLSRGLIYRVAAESRKGGDDAEKPQFIRCMELHPNFVRDHQGEDSSWRVMSMGEYLSQLRLLETDENDDHDFVELVENELKAIIGSALIQNLGPRLGPVLLPMLGLSSLEVYTKKLANVLVSWVSGHLLHELVQQSQWDPLEDKAAFPVSPAEVVSILNINQKIFSSKQPAEVSSLDWMNRGEIGFDPPFYDVPTAEAKSDGGVEVDKRVEKTQPQKTDSPSLCLIPNYFVVEEHFSIALEGMEDRIRGKSEVTDTPTAANSAEVTKTSKPYDPNDRSLPDPTPVNPRILPDLHFGWGNAQCTHTKREILRNRLFANLLTKLSYNYYLVEQQGTLDPESAFIVEINGKRCLFPDQFVEGLIETGHTIEVCPRSVITTFGIAACVKEDDGSWTNVPIAFFFRTGFEHEDGRPSFFNACHGGMDMKIQGPLVGTNPTTGRPNNCDVQFYVAIEGVSAWHSNHNVDVPWIKSVSVTDVYTTEKALQAIRMAGLLGVSFNSIATQMNLPMGGYGVLGVCNDSAALLDTAIQGDTNMYPLVSTGRFLFVTGNRLISLRQGLSASCKTGSKQDAGDGKGSLLLSLEKALSDARRLVTAACNMDSDIHCSPANLVKATRRYLANNPVSYFQLTQDSKSMMEQVSSLYQDFVESDELNGRGGNHTNDSEYGHDSNNRGSGMGLLNFVFNSVPQDNSKLLR